MFGANFKYSIDNTEDNISGTIVIKRSTTPKTYKNK